MFPRKNGERRPSRVINVARFIVVHGAIGIRKERELEEIKQETRFLNVGGAWVSLMQNGFPVKLKNNSS